MESANVAGLAGSVRTTKSEEPQGFDAAAGHLNQRFKRLWATRDPSLIGGIVAADGESFWSGQGAVAGRDYSDRWQSLVRAVDALEFTVTGRAAEDPYLFISWHARGTVGAMSVEFDGVDRFRLRGELADEVYVVFDPAPIRELRGTARPSSGS
jgi:hypothetical protein